MRLWILGRVFLWLPLLAPLGCSRGSEAEPLGSAHSALIEGQLRLQAEIEARRERQLYQKLVEEEQAKLDERLEETRVRRAHLEEGEGAAAGKEPEDDSAELRQRRQELAAVAGRIATAGDEEWGEVRVELDAVVDEVNRSLAKVSERR